MITDHAEHPVFPTPREVRPERERHVRFAYLFVGLIVGWGIAQAALVVSEAVVECRVMPVVSGVGV